MKIAIVSGYFNPIHVGHIRLFRSASELADHLIVIVNNDAQQIMKKGKIIMKEDDRLYIVQNLIMVDRAVLAIDTDPSVRATLIAIHELNKHDQLIFCNGGDRRSATDSPETEICKELGIEMRFGVGGLNKYDSSTRITNGG